MNARKMTVDKLTAAGYIFKRHGANHDIYYNPQTRKTISVKRHDFDENDARYVLKEAGLK